MEENYTPRTRNRRAARLPDEAEQAAAYPQQVQQMPAQLNPPQPAVPVQPAPQAAFQPPVQQMVYPQQQYGQYPQQQLPAQQMPLQPSPYARPAANPPQGAPGYPPVPSQPVQPAMNQPMMNPSRPAQPRVLQQRQANSGWTMPDVPQARAAHGLQRDIARENRQQARQLQARKAAAATKEDQDKPDKKAKAAKKKMPGWLSTALSLSVILVMGLFAAFWLMQAYLTTQENERIAAHNAMLNNYHVTEHADGRHTVTWQETIERYAAQYNLQPAFVTAVIRNESSFRTNAESSVGARGLMQMMPDTAEWIAGKLNDRNYSYDSMWDGETNIRYGCWYLGYLSELFGGDAVLVASAYHAGQGEVRSWLGDRSISPDGKTVPIENIPIFETKTYAGRVTQAYGIYQALLYGHAVPAADASAAR